MTTQEIQDHIEAAIRSKFDGYTSESMEMMTSEGGDGRFLGKVMATRYLGIPQVPDIYLVIGKTAKGIQIMKLGRSECLNPTEGEIDFLLLKELGVGGDEEEVPSEHDQ